MYSNACHSLIGGTRRLAYVSGTKNGPIRMLRMLQSYRTSIKNRRCPSGLTKNNYTEKTTYNRFE